jgi:hypothetical protein
VYVLNANHILYQNQDSGFKNVVDVVVALLGNLSRSRLKKKSGLRLAITIIG